MQSPHFNIKALKKFIIRKKTNKTLSRVINVLKQVQLFDKENSVKRKKRKRVKKTFRKEETKTAKEEKNTALVYNVSEDVQHCETFRKIN